MIWAFSIVISCIKLLLLPAYHSTDFDVHRNWLAITHNLPYKQWYYEDTSIWTLDYPPLFAWFEYTLSLFAQFFDPNMLIIQSDGYSSHGTILYQRLTVIVSDLIFIFATHRCCKLFPRGKRAHIILPVLLIGNPGLLMLDHIHFQYNGMLYGILMLSISYIMQEKYLQGAFWFSILINMKHIYLYIAPVFFIYLLRNFCFKSKTNNVRDLFQSFAFRNFVRLGSIVLLISVISFGPFIYDIKQVLSRLFPFKRGLSHAYWAPNFWAIYNIIDKSALVFASKVGVHIDATTASMTGGLVQEFSHSILPNITPLMTIILSVLSMIPALTKLWKLKSNHNNFVRCIVLCGLSSFMFGWHVHEKAILMAVIPLR